MRKIYVFDIKHPGDPAAGIIPYKNVLRVKFENDHGGEEGEFLKEFLIFLHHWFDGANILAFSITKGVFKRYESN
jgi:hypothetical protein